MIVLDTQVVVWLDGDRGKLSRAALEAIADSAKQGHSLAIADITLLEIATAVSRGRIEATRGLAATLRNLEAIFDVLPIDASVAERATQFKDPFPRDPADRIIAATVIVRGAKLITADQRIRKSRQVPCIW